MSEPAVGTRVRSRNDGQVGYIHPRPDEDGGGLGVRLDRKQQTIIVPYSSAKWVVEERGPLTPMQMARVAYAADAALRAARGEYGVTEWQDMREPARLKWLNGPEAPDVERGRVYAAVMKALKA
jgi:hypothetical protein